MSINFGTLKTAVGNRVGDTGSSMKTLIGQYINHRYKDVLRRTNWRAINPDFSITATSASTVASASTYTMPSDFGKPLYVFDTNSEKKIEGKPLNWLEELAPSELQTTGTVDYYSIFTTTDSTAASAETSAGRVTKMRFWRAPAGDVPMLIPYTMRPADLSSDSDELVIACEQAVEYGAAADAWMYKRSFGKAQHMEAKYEQSIQTLLWDQDNESDQVTMMNVQALNRDEGI